MKKYIDRLLAGAPISTIILMIIESMNREDLEHFKLFVSEMNLPRRLKRKIAKELKIK